MDLSFPKACQAMPFALNRPIQVIKEQQQHQQNLEMELEATLSDRIRSPDPEKAPGTPWR